MQRLEDNLNSVDELKLQNRLDTIEKVIDQFDEIDMDSEIIASTIAVDNNADASKLLFSFDIDTKLSDEDTRELIVSALGSTAVTIPAKVVSNKLAKSTKREKNTLDISKIPFEHIVKCQSKITTTKKGVQKSSELETEQKADKDVPSAKSSDEDTRESIIPVLESTAVTVPAKVVSINFDKSTDREENILDISKIPLEHIVQCQFKITTAEKGVEKPSELDTEQ